MDNSVYVTLSHQLALFRDMDVTANNVANANTGGYGAEHIMFDSYVTQDMSSGVKNPMAFANDVGTYRDTRGGPLQATGNDLDVAIEGNGYFTVQTPLGPRYTRSGHFRLDGSGTLVTAEGYPVLDTSGQHIEMPENTTSVQIGELGNIKVNGDDFGALGVVQFDHPQLLERAGGSLYKSAVTPQPAQDFHVAQKMLESSNVQPVMELTHMVNVSHAVSDTVQLIGVVYDLERKTSDAWAQQS
ncbi:MAG: flagellar basal-body rod protein FlgF [Pseudomonadota bacterium]|nr:flagellar basal-body rod protein FlgF [Pseudomonadota bacterium]